MGVTMPNFISAYKLQQRDGLTRQRVIELAEIGPVYWKASDCDLYRPDVKYGYFEDGFPHLKRNALRCWSAFAMCTRNANVKQSIMKKNSWNDWDIGFLFNLKQLNEWLGPLFDDGKQRVDTNVPSVYPKYLGTQAEINSSTDSSLPNEVPRVDSIWACEGKKNEDNLAMACRVVSSL